MNMQSQISDTKGAEVPDWMSQVDALRAQGKHGVALGLLLPRLQKGLMHYGALERAAMCFFDLADGASAIGLLEVMTQKWPDRAGAWAKLGLVRGASGDKPGAISAYRRALKIDPTLVPVLFVLNKLEPFAKQSTKTTRLRKLSQSKALSAQDRAMAFNTLGKIEHRAKNHKAAFRYYSKSKKAWGGTYKPDAIDQLVADQAAQFQPRQAQGAADGHPRIIFVCGMPRSGTTLVENILLRHSEVDSIGESHALKSVLKSMRQQVASTGRGQGYWDWSNALDPNEIAGFRHCYFAQALSGKPDPAKVIIDKMPLNCLDLGAAHVLLPEAKFIFMSRHPLDVALSNFATCYSDDVAFSRRLEWIGHLIAAVYRAQGDYAPKLGGQLRRQSYEALVTQAQDQIHHLLDHVDLSWEAACLTPEQNKVPVRTASVTQVREKINIRGLGKWREYEDQLAPVIAALGGERWIEDWAAQDRDAAQRGG